MPPSGVDASRAADLSAVMRASAAGDPVTGTLLDPAYRAAHPVVEAEHTPYPHLDRARPRYRQPLRAVIAADRKVILRGDADAVLVDPRADADERHAEPVAPDAFHRLVAECAPPEVRHSALA